MKIWHHFQYCYVLNCASPHQGLTRFIFSNLSRLDFYHLTCSFTKECENHSDSGSKYSKGSHLLAPLRHTYVHYCISALVVLLIHNYLFTVYLYLTNWTVNAHYVRSVMAGCSKQTANHRRKAWEMYLMFLVPVWKHSTNSVVTILINSL